MMTHTTILVTGGTGFLGQHLVRRLAGLGYRVAALGRNVAIGQQLESEGIRFVRADLADADGIALACKEQHYVFHCGALSAPWGKVKDFYDANALGTRHIVNACQQWNVSRLIHVSSPSVYYDGRHALNIPESSPLPQKFVNHYAHTKHLAELEVTKGYKKGLATIILRPRAIFGPGDHTIFPRLIRANRRTGIPYINKGQALTDVTYVDNVVDALIHCISSPETTVGKTYNISNGTPKTMGSLLTLLFDELDEPLRRRPVSYPIAYGLASLMEAFSVLGTEPLLTRYTVGALSTSQTLDISLARKELHYKPSISIEEGIKRFAIWWKEQAHVTH